MPRRLLATPLAILGLLAAAPAALAAQPSALGTDNDGVSYVGYPTTGGIQRFAPADGSSTARPAWGTPGTGAGQLGGIVGIGVGAGSNGRVWVLDTNRRVQEFTKDGAFLRGVELPACASGVTPDATRYGGIDVRADNSTDAPAAVYVAHPCANQVLKLDPSTLATSATRTTSSRPGRIAAQRYTTAAESARGVFVGLPDEKKVATLSLGDLAPLTFPLATRSYSYTPSDLFIDAFGVLFVGAKEEGRIYQYNDQGNEIRWIGGQGSDVGRLNDPQAFDVFGQYGGDLAGNVFIADSGNSRIQRMNPYGYTFWASSATGTGGGQPGGGTAAPVNSTAPAISGTPTVGQQLTCSQGTWTNAPTGYAYQWLRAGTAISGATGSQYTVVSADAGQPITCRVTATNATGSATATSAAVTPTTGQAPATAPVNSARPGIQGTPVVGNTLSCSQGTWSNSPTAYAYAWRRDGTAIAGATGQSYALVAADAGRTLTCAVTASNSAGAATAVSDGVAVSAAPTTPSTRVGVSINGGAEATNSTSVTLTIREPSGATAVLISNDGSFDNATQLPVAANDTYAWTLDARGSQRRSRVVYVRFVGLTDVNQTFSDDIVLDTTAPMVTTASTSSTPSDRTARVRVAARDTGSGVQTVQYARNQSPASAKSVRASKARSFTVRPRNARWVRAIDAAGNKSKWKRIAYRAPKKAVAR